MKFEDIKRLEEKLYQLSLSKTLTMLADDKMVPWPIPFGFERAYVEMQVYFEGTNKSLHAMKKIGKKEEYYFIVRKKAKVKSK